MEIEFDKKYLRELYETGGFRNGYNGMQYFRIVESLQIK